MFVLFVFQSSAWLEHGRDLNDLRIGLAFRGIQYDLQRLVSDLLPGKGPGISASFMDFVRSSIRHEIIRSVLVSVFYIELSARLHDGRADFQTLHAAVAEKCHAVAAMDTPRSSDRIPRIIGDRKSVV